MIFDTLHRLPVAAALLSSLCLGGCGSSVITSDCEELARTHCESCQNCGSDDVPPSSVCRLRLGTDAFSVDACVAEIVPRCEQQTPLVDNLEDRHDACQQALQDQQCADLYERYTHERDPFAPVCRFFF